MSTRLLRAGMMGGQAVADTWSPSALFQSGEVGGAWDFTDLSQMYTDAGSTPTTSVDDPVYRVNDIGGNGRYVENTGGTTRPLVKQNGTTYALLDGEDDYLRCPTTDTWGLDSHIMVALRPLATAGIMERFCAVGKSLNLMEIGRRRDISRYNIVFRGNDNGHTLVNSASATSDVFPAGTDAIIEGVWSNELQTVYHNGAEVFSDPTPWVTGETMAGLLMQFGLSWADGTYSNFRAYRAIARYPAITGDDLINARAWLEAGYEGITG